MLYVGILGHVSGFLCFDVLNRTNDLTNMYPISNQRKRIARNLSIDTGLCVTVKYQEMLKFLKDVYFKIGSTDFK